MQATPPLAAFPLLLAYSGAPNGEFQVIDNAASWHANDAVCRAWLGKHPRQIATAKSIQKKGGKKGWALVLCVNNGRLLSYPIFDTVEEQARGCDCAGNEEYDTDTSPPLLAA